MAQISASGDDGATAENVVLTLTVPKVRDAAGNLLISSPAFVDSELAAQAGGGTTRSETDDAWVLTYTFPIMKGGQFSQLPFDFSFLDGITANGTTVTPTIELAIGGVKSDEKSIIFTAKATDAHQVRERFDTIPGYLKDKNGDVLDPNGQKIGVIPFYSETQTNHTPATGLTQTYGVCTTALKDAERPGNQGNFRYQTMTYDCLL